MTRENTGGGERTRTADFHVANVALYQLSYTPGRDRHGPSDGFLWTGPAESGRRLRLAEHTSPLREDRDPHDDARPEGVCDDRLPAEQRLSDLRP